MYDVTKEDSFDNLTTWLERVESSANDSKIVKMLIGNKIDLENIRSISSKDGEEFAASHEMLFIETSALASTNIEEAFEKIVE